MIKEYLTILLLLPLILGFVYLLYSTGILRRKVLVTTINNLPIGIFKESNAQIEEETVEECIEENSESDEYKLIKCNNENVENDLKKI